MSDIIEQINALVAAGYSLDEIRVNGGNSEWGDDCAVTQDSIDALRAKWEMDGNDVSRLPELQTAREWYATQMDPGPGDRPQTRRMDNGSSSDHNRLFSRAWTAPHS